MIDYNEKHILYKIQNTVLELLSDRNYIVDNKYNISFNEFCQYLEKGNINILSSGERGDIYVYFYNDNKNFGKNEFKNTVNKIREDNHPDINIIIIVKEKENSAVRRELTLPLYSNVEIFIHKQLTFNITKHDIVPKHILLSDEEINILTNTYNTPRQKFPKILIDDPISKYFGVKHGDMFKIIRKSYSVGEINAYRIVK